MVPLDPSIPPPYDLPSFTFFKIQQSFGHNQNSAVPEKKATIAKQCGVAWKCPKICKEKENPQNFHLFHQQERKAPEKVPFELFSTKFCSCQTLREWLQQIVCAVGCGTSQSFTKRSLFWMHSIHQALKSAGKPISRSQSQNIVLLKANSMLGVFTGSPMHLRRTSETSWGCSAVMPRLESRMPSSKMRFAVGQGQEHRCNNTQKHVEQSQNSGNGLTQKGKHGVDFNPL